MLRPDKSCQRRTACGRGNRLVEIFSSRTLSAVRTTSMRNRIWPRPTWDASPSLPRCRPSFDLVRRVADETIYKTMTCPWHLERTVAASIAPPLAAGLMPGAHLLLIRWRDAAQDMRAKNVNAPRRTPSAADVLHGASPTNYQRPQAKPYEPRPRPSTTRRLLRGSCPAHIGCSPVRVIRTA